MDLQNYGRPDILRMHQIVKKVSRERHRMKAFIRFVKSDNNLFTAIVEPDFNVIPLVVDFFRNRYTDQQWLIYDIRRNYGFYYDCISTQIIVVKMTSVILTASNWISTPKKRSSSTCGKPTLKAPISNLAKI